LGWHVVSKSNSDITMGKISIPLSTPIGRILYHAHRSLQLGFATPTVAQVTAACDLLWAQVWS
jgi:hypothetical protein